MSDDHHERRQDIAAKRESARRARRLAWQLTAREDQERLLAFAAKLEAEADELEEAARPKKAVTQMQMQVQQGSSSKEPPDTDE